ncbi:MAG: putative rane protein [Herbinix sp.]|nr:putative rane protein [Herbinix sp.]
MNKVEFLTTLRQALDGEVDSFVLEQNITYYDQYIGSGDNLDQENRLSSLGDPRLIAKTIIEADRAAGNKFKQTANQNHYNEWHETASQQNKNDQKGQYTFTSNIKWYHKIAFVFALIFLLLVLLILGGFFLRILFTIGFPILVLIFIFTLFRRR